MLGRLQLICCCYAALLLVAAGTSCVSIDDCSTDEICSCRTTGSRRSRQLTMKVPRWWKKQQHPSVPHHGTATHVHRRPDLGEAELGRRLFGAPNGGGATTCTCAAAPLPPSLPPPSPPPPAPPPAPILVEWQSTVHAHCAPNPPPGTLTKTSGSGAWTCAAFTNAAPYQVQSANDARHAIEFNCGCTSNHVNIGFMRANNPSFNTWESNIQNACSSNSACDYYNHGIEYGVSCRSGGNLYMHYNDQETHQHIGSFSATSVLRIELGANTVTWYRDGSQIAQKSVTPTFPQNVFATFHDTSSCLMLQNLKLAL